jgi:hypothetical protein
MALILPGLAHLLLELRFKKWPTAHTKAKRGRPKEKRAPTSLLTGPNVVPRGRPQRYDRLGILQWVEAHKRKSGGQMSDAQALCEGIREALKTVDPSKANRIEAKMSSYVYQGLSEKRALRRAVVEVEGKHFRKLTVLLSQARRSNNRVEK